MTALEAAMAKAVAPADKLISTRLLAAKAREIQLEVLNLEERIADLKKQLRDITEEQLPELMDEAGIAKLELERDGNMPAVKVAMKPFYRAGISASWDDERKEKAYNWLVEHDAGDLIKATVTIKFNKESYSDAISLAKELAETYSNVNVDRNVHGGTLSAWLKEQVEECGRSDIPLDVIGGSMGRIVKIDIEKRKK